MGLTKDFMSVEEIVWYMITAIIPRKAILELAFDRGLGEDKKQIKKQEGMKLEKWILTEMLVKLIELRDFGFLRCVEGEHSYPFPKVRFSIPITSEIECNLNNGKIPKILHEKFENFCTESKIKSMKVPREHEPVKSNGCEGWVIDDKAIKRKYFIRKKGNMLNIHALDHEQCDLWWCIDNKEKRNEEHWLEVKTLVIKNNRCDVDESKISTDISKSLSLRQSNIDEFHHLSIVFLESSCIETLKKKLDMIYMEKEVELSLKTVRSISLGQNRFVLFMLYS